MTFHQPLDLQYWLVNTFAGSVELFIFIAVLFLAILGGRFQMPNKIALPLLALFIIVMNSTVLGGAVSGLYLVVILLVSMTTYYAIAKMFKYI